MKRSVHTSLRYPFSKIVEVGTPTYAPRTISVAGAVMTGSAAGWGAGAARGAYGEFFERNHFMLNVTVDHVAPLSDCGQALSESLIQLFDQVKKVKNEPTDIAWRLAKATNLLSGAAVYYPVSLISLFNDSQKELDFLPHSDSTGCAAHNTKAMATYKGMMEMLERQSMVAAWLLRKPVRTIDPSVILSVPMFEEMGKKLLGSGEIKIYDLAHGLPGYGLFITYFSRSSKDKVQYAVGCAFELSCEAALQGALEELWQDYYYLYCSDAIAERMKHVPGISYNHAHMADNTQETRQLIPFGEQKEAEIKNYDAVCQLKKYSWDEVLNSLKKISTQVICYHYHDVMRDLHVVKVHSPDFFLHMSLEQKNNLVNKYAQSIGIDPDTAVLGRIPFP